MTEETANTYFENQVKPLFAVNPLKETMIQKYLALWGHRERLPRLLMISVE